jgi:predicted TIM-barrel fold metal-dependent hydrolase
VRIVDAHATMAPVLQPSSGPVRTLMPASTPRELIAALDRYGIEKAVLFAPRVPGQDAYDLNYRLGNRAVADVVHAYPERVIGFARIYASGFTECSSELIRCKDEYGFRGLMLNPDWEFTGLGRALLDPYLALAQAWSWPVLFHIGVAGLSAPAALVPLAKRFPRLVIIGAHLGYDMINDLIAAAELSPNIYLETSANATPSAIQEVIKRLGPNRLIYGSGLPYAFPDHIYDKINRVEGLSEADRQAILGGTMLRLLRLN